MRPCRDTKPIMETLKESSTDLERETAYAYSLAHLLRLDSKSATQIFELFPNQEAWRIPWADRPSCQCAPNLKDKLSVLAATNWESVIERAIKEIRGFNDAQINVISSSNPLYPSLLRLCPDRPIVLFLKGASDIFGDFPAIAIVGGRRSSPVEEHLASQIAEFLAGSDCLVVSSLNQGIDTAVQRGVIDCGRRGLVVFGSPLNRIYPAENKNLAFRILDRGGSWISELPVGSKNAFRKWQRVAVGLSVATMPIQIETSRSAKRAVRWAESYSRLLLCPQSLVSRETPKERATTGELFDLGNCRELREGTLMEICRQMSKHRTLLENTCVAGEMKQA